MTNETTKVIKDKFGEIYISNFTNLTWQAVDYTRGEMKLNLQFYEPLVYSQTTARYDRVYVRVLNETILEPLDKLLRLSPESYVMDHRIKRQLDKSLHSYVWFFGSQQIVNSLYAVSIS